MSKKKLSRAEARRQYDSRPSTQYNQDFTSWLIWSSIILDDGYSESRSYDNGSSSFNSSSYDSCSSYSSDSSSSSSSCD